MVITAFTLTLPGTGQGITIEPEVRMLALGDSYTIGQSVQPEERWPHQFVAELRKLGISAVDPDYIATTGWTTRDLLNGINATLDPSRVYNLVSILIGVNNQYQGIDISTYEPDLEEIIQRALQIVNYDTGRVFMLSIPDYAFTPFGNGRISISEGIDAYNAINNRVAGAYRIPYVDVTTLSRQGLDHPELVAGDGLHPSGEQYAGWVANILPLLRIWSPSTLLDRPSGSPERDMLRIIPNPATSSILIQSTVHPETYRIKDNRGSVIEESLVTANPLLMEVSHLPPGVYYLEATFARNRLIRSFILN